MLISKTAKLDKVLGKDPLQSILHQPYLHIDDLDEQGEDGSQRGYILASSGQEGVVIPVELELGDVAGPVPIECLKDVRKLGGSIACTDQWCVVAASGVGYPRGIHMGSGVAYPPLQAVIDAGLVGEGIEISLDAKVLMNMAEAFGSNVLKLSVSSVDDPIVVTPHPSLPHVDGSVGFLLPFRMVRV